MEGFDSVFAASLFFSFLLGLLASYIWWKVTTHYWVPDITFSEELAEYRLKEPGQHFIQCAFRNSGKREIIDLEIIVRIGVRNFMGASGWAYHEVKSNASRVPTLEPRRDRRVRIYDTRTSIQFENLPSKSLKEALEKATGFREVLQLGTQASVRIHVFGYDSFSGSRKHFSSKRYGLHDLRIGTFKGLDVVANKRFPKS